MYESCCEIHDILSCCLFQCARYRTHWNIVAI